MRLYCTQFDSEFLSRGIAMIRSVRRFDACAAIRVVALDSKCAEILRDLFGAAVTVVEPAEFPELRAGRSPWAYYATLKPFGIAQALEGAEAGSVVAFVDADTWFFSDPSPLFAEFDGASIGLSPHRYSQGLESYAEFGTYNAGCILWRADSEALRCARDWSRDCIECCGGREMNQGYLQNWPERYSGVHVISHAGVNVAPWNVDNYELASDGAGVSVGGQPVIFYHFSGMVPGEGNVWHSFHSHRHRQLDFLRERLYAPYLTAVEAERAMLQKRYGMDGTGNLRSELKAGPGTLRFRASGQVPAAVSRREDNAVEAERHRTAIRALVDAGMTDAALLALRTAGPPLHGSPAEWEYYMGYCLHTLRKDRKAALGHYAAALALGYDEFWVRFHRGQLLLDLKRREEAAADLRRALELRPHHKGLSVLCYSV